MWQPVNGRGGASSQGKGVGNENCCVQAAVLSSVSMCLFLLWFFQVPQADLDG